MATRTVSLASANAAKDAKSPVFTSMELINDLVALTSEIKADYALLRAQLLNRTIQAPLLAEGTNSATIKTTNAVSFSINGVLYTKAATDNIAITAAAVQAVSTYCLYLVSIIADGTVTVTKGTASAADDAVLPALPADSAPLGYFKIATNGSTTYTAGTTDNGAGGITDTYVDLSVMNSGTSASTAIAAADVDTIATRELGAP